MRNKWFLCISQGFVSKKKSLEREGKGHWLEAVYCQIGPCKNHANLCGNGYSISGWRKQYGREDLKLSLSDPLVHVNPSVMYTYWRGLVPGRTQHSRLSELQQWLSSSSHRDYICFRGSTYRSFDSVNPRTGKSTYSLSNFPGDAGAVRGQALKLSELQSSLWPGWRL